jgi:hypothetical protein
MSATAKRQADAKTKHYRALLNRCRILNRMACRHEDATRALVDETGTFFEAVADYTGIDCETLMGGGKRQ